MSYWTLAQVCQSVWANVSVGAERAGAGGADAGDPIERAAVLVHVHQRHGIQDGVGVARAGAGGVALGRQDLVRVPCSRCRLDRLDVDGERRVANGGGRAGNDHRVARARASMSACPDCQTSCRW